MGITFQVKKIICFTVKSAFWLYFRLLTRLYLNNYTVSTLLDFVRKVDFSILYMWQKPVSQMQSAVENPAFHQVYIYIIFH